MRDFCGFPQHPDRKELPADERGCTQIRTVNHPTDRAMIGCIPPGSQSRTNFICVHLCASVVFILLSCSLRPGRSTPLFGRPLRRMEPQMHTDAHRCTQMTWGAGRLTGDVPRDAYVGAVADNPSHDGEGPARQPIRSLLGVALAAGYQHRNGASGSAAGRMDAAAAMHNSGTAGIM